LELFSGHEGWVCRRVGFKSGSRDVAAGLVRGCCGSSPRGLKIFILQSVRTGSGAHRACNSLGIEQWFPAFFHLRTPWQPISLNCTLHISSTTRHNVHLIPQLLTCILSYTVDVCAFCRHYSIFFFAYP
jgi:hypothetical protein